MCSMPEIVWHVLCWLYAKSSLVSHCCCCEHLTTEESEVQKWLSIFLKINHKWYNQNSILDLLDLTSHITSLSAALSSRYTSFYILGCQERLGEGSSEGRIWIRKWPLEGSWFRLSTGSFSNRAVKEWARQHCGAASFRQKK